MAVGLSVVGYCCCSVDSIFEIEILKLVSILLLLLSYCLKYTVVVTVAVAVIVAVVLVEVALVVAGAIVDNKVAEVIDGDDDEDVDVDEVADDDDAAKVGGCWTTDADDGSVLYVFELVVSGWVVPGGKLFKYCSCEICPLRCCCCCSVCDGI